MADRAYCFEASKGVNHAKTALWTSEQQPKSENANNVFWQDNVKREVKKKGSKQYKANYECCRTKPSQQESETAINKTQQTSKKTQTATNDNNRDAPLLNRRLARVCISRPNLHKKHENDLIVLNSNNNNNKQQSTNNKQKTTNNNKQHQNDKQNDGLRKHRAQKRTVSHKSNRTHQHGMTLTPATTQQ